MRKLRRPAAMKIKSADIVTLPGANLVYKASSHYLKQVFFCEFYEISKNTFFTEHLQRLLLTIIISSLTNRIFYLFHEHLRLFIIHAFINN